MIYLYISSYSPSRWIWVDSNVQYPSKRLNWVYWKFYQVSDEQPLETVWTRLFRWLITYVLRSQVVARSSSEDIDEKQSELQKKK